MNTKKKDKVEKKEVEKKIESKKVSTFKKKRKLLRTLPLA